MSSSAKDPGTLLRRYAVFISYRHADNKETGRQWAIWLHQALETYEIPKDLIGQINSRGEPTVASLYPVFRDEEELPADADLTQNIRLALEQSATMAVLCSPRAVDSRFVADEIRVFKELGKSDRILAVLLDGEPNASEDPGKLKLGMGPELECLPEPLRYGVRRADGCVDWSQRTEPIAADVRPEGRPAQGWTTGAAYRESLLKEGNLSAKEVGSKVREYEQRLDLAKLKVIAGALGVPLGTLTQRDQAYQLARARARARTFRRVAVALALLALIAIAGGLVAWQQRQEAKRQQHQLQLAFSRADCTAALDRANNHQDPEAVAYLCRALRTDPGNHEAAALLFSVLSTRSWAASEGSFHVEGEDLVALDANGRMSLTRSGQTGRVWDIDAHRVVRELPNFQPSMIPPAFSPDGRYLILSGDHELQRLDLATGERSSLGQGDDLNWFGQAFRFSPDGQAVALGHEGQIQSWSIASRQPIGSPVDEPANPYDGVPSAISRDGSTLLAEGGRVIAWDPSGGLRLADLRSAGLHVWDTATLRPICSLSDYSSTRLQWADFSPDRAWVRAATIPDQPTTATANTYNTLRIWSASTGEPRPFTMTEEEDIAAASWSADSQLILTASQNLLHLWNAATGQLETPPLHTPDRVLDAWFTRDGKRIVAVTVKTAGVKLGEEAGLRQYALNPASPAKDSPYEPDTVMIWAGAPTPSAVASWRQEPWVLDAKFSPDGRWIVTASERGAQIWDASTRELKSTLAMEEVPVCIDFAPDSSRLLLVGANHTAQVWDPATGRAVAGPFRDHAELEYAIEHNHSSVTSVGFAGPKHPERARSGKLSPNGKQLALASGFGAKVWDVASGQSLTPALRHEGWVTAVSFSRDGRRLLTFSREDGTARLWDAATGKPIAKPIRPPGGIVTATLSPDGERIATAAADSAVQIWNVVTGQAASSFRPAEKTTAIELSPDGQWVATLSGKTARVWNAASGSAISLPMTHKSKLTSVTFSPDGEYLLTAGEDRCARIFDARTGRPVAAPIVHGNAVNAASFSTDGKRVVTADDDGVVKVWPFSAALPPAWILDLAESLAGCRLDPLGAPAYLPGETAVSLRRQCDHDANAADPMVVWARQILNDGSPP